VQASTFGFTTDELDPGVALFAALGDAESAGDAEGAVDV